MVLKPNILRCFETIFFHRKTEGPGQKPYEKIGFSALGQSLGQVLGQGLLGPGLGQGLDQGLGQRPSVFL